MSTERQSRVNVTDQRYYHVASLVPRTQSFGMRALRSMIAAEFQTSDGRLKTDSERSSHRVEAFCIHASPGFADSEDARRAMAVRGKELCAYDAFAVEIRLKGPVRGWPPGAKSLLVVGTGYASLTRHVFGRLSRQSGLLRRALFAVPDLDGIVALCRRRKPNLDARLTLTGVSTLRPGGKYVRGVRLSGKDVLAGGILDVIEDWMRTTAPEEGATGSSASVRSDSVLTLQSLRIRGELPQSADAATMTIARDGSTKIWMRAKGTSVQPFATSIGTMSSMRLFAASSDQPRWAEESEF